MTASIVPPDTELVSAVAELVIAYSKLEWGDPIKLSVGGAIEALLSPVIVVSTPA